MDSRECSLHPLFCSPIWLMLQSAGLQELLKHNKKILTFECYYFPELHPTIPKLLPSHSPLSQKNRCHLPLRHSFYSSLTCAAKLCYNWAKMKPGVKPSFIIRRKKINVCDSSLQLVSQIQSYSQIRFCFQILNRDYSPEQVVMCLGLCPTAVWFPCDLETVSPGLSSRQGDRCPQETNVPRPTFLDTVTFCDTNHIFWCSYQKVSFESDDNFGCRLMHADGCHRWRPALLLLEKNMCPHDVVPGGPRKTPTLPTPNVPENLLLELLNIYWVFFLGKVNVHTKTYYHDTCVFQTLSRFVLHPYPLCYHFRAHLPTACCEQVYLPPRAFLGLLSRTEIPLKSDILL